MQVSLDKVRQLKCFNMQVLVIAVLVLLGGAVRDCKEGDLQLTTLEEDGFALVRYCFRKAWRGVCDTDANPWTKEAAGVACMQLGYSDKGQTESSKSTPSSQFEKFIAITACDGTENSVQECGVIGATKKECKNLGLLKCNKALCNDGEIRLVGEVNATKVEGRVEVCLSGRWGTVQTNESMIVAEAVCSSLSAELESPTSARLGYRRAKPVYNCCVTEPNNGRLNCQTAMDNATHEQDLGVVCLPSSEPPKSEGNNSLGALTGLLMITLTAVVIGWIASCVYWLRKSKHSDGHTHQTANNSHQLDNPVYDPVNESSGHKPVAKTNYSQVGPTYEKIEAMEQTGYDVINRNGAPRPHPPMTHDQVLDQDYSMLSST